MFIPTIIDIEVSGFGEGSYPVEVGFITYDQQVACTLIKPDENWSSYNSDAE